MAKYTEAQAKAVKTYLEKNNLVEIKFRVNREKREEYKEQAEKKGKSLNSLIIEAINEKIERECINNE